jgi:AcrR family transcriptional regulator
MLQRTGKTPKPKTRLKTRKNDPERTKRDIIDVATVEFAAEGYSGARVDTIAAKTRTSKRMI